MGIIKRGGEPGRRLWWRIERYEVDFGEGFVSVDPDPWGSSLDVQRIMRVTATSPNYPVSGEAAHSLACGRLGCGGCWWPSGTLQSMAAWLEQVPVLFPGAIGARISGEGLVAMVCVETGEPVELGEKTEMIH